MAVRERNAHDVPMGWCLPGSEDHKNCRVQYTDWNNEERVCSCSCHKTKTSRKSKAARSA